MSGQPRVQLALGLGRGTSQVCGRVTDLTHRQLQVSALGQNTNRFRCGRRGSSLLLRRSLLLLRTCICRGLTLNVRRAGRTLDMLCRRLLMLDRGGMWQSRLTGCREGMSGRGRFHTIGSDAIYGRGIRPGRRNRDGADWVVCGRLARVSSRDETRRACMMRHTRTWLRACPWTRQRLPADDGLRMNPVCPVGLPVRWQGVRAASPLTIGKPRALAVIVAPIVA